LTKEGTVSAYSLKIQRIVDDYNLVSTTKASIRYYLLQGIKSNEFGIWLTNFVTAEIVNITSTDMMGYLKQEMEDDYGERFAYPIWCDIKDR
jgi:hypothetical protein